MRILMILQADFPPDIRVEKEVRSLAHAGHEVHLICKNVTGRKDEEIYPDLLYIHRLRAAKSWLHRWDNLRMFPIPQNPVWKQRICEVIQNFGIEAIHVHDLPLAPLAVKLGRKFNLPVIFDMHENYPAALKAWRKRGPEKLLKNAWVARWVEKRVVHQVDRIIVVIEEQKVRLVNMGVPPDRIRVISNTVDIKHFHPTNGTQQIRKKLAAEYILIYVGGVDENRGLETLIEAFSIVAKKNFSTKLLILGDGRKRHELECKVKARGLVGRVIFTGWVNFHQVPDYIAASDVCLVPHPSNEHSDTTVPHKIFQYMALGKPVIVSDAKPLARIIRETKAGVVFRSNDPRELAEVIFSLQDKRKRKALGEKGQHAVREKYNWKHTAETLLTLYSELQQSDITCES